MKTKTDAAKALLALGWEVEDVFRVLEINAQPVIRIVHEYPRWTWPYATATPAVWYGSSITTGTPAQSFGTGDSLTTLSVTAG